MCIWENAVVMKKVLILGKGSYLGEQFQTWLNLYPEEYYVRMIGTKDGEWKKEEFAKYDCVVNFSGLAHIKNITPDMEEAFYSVNRDLAIEMGKWAKKCGVKHFVHLSSMNVYGDANNNIIDRNQTAPTSFYGDSKLQGEIGLQQLATEGFVVSCVRPPFVYGSGCKGNYNLVRKLALKLPIFPTYKNKKSMIYVDNLSEFIRLTIDARAGGTFTPQNKELVSTAELVKEISRANGHKILFVGVFDWLMPLAKKISGMARKAFGDDCYCEELSGYYEWKYCVVNFKDSIELTEGKR